MKSISGIDLTKPGEALALAKRSREVDTVTHGGPEAIRQPVAEAIAGIGNPDPSRQALLDSIRIIGGGRGLGFSPPDKPLQAKKHHELLGLESPKN